MIGVAPSKEIRRGRRRKKDEIRKREGVEIFGNRQIEYPVQVFQ